MTVCPHCYTDSATLKWQAERIEELEQEVRAAKQVVLPSEQDVAKICEKSTACCRAGPHAPPTQATSTPIPGIGKIV